MNKNLNILDISAKFLIFVFLLRLFSFLTMFEFIGSAVVIKTFMRMSSDVLLGILLFRTTRKKLKVNFLVLGLLYLIYIGLAILSLLYTSSFEASLTQLFMYLESILFSYLFIRVILLKDNPYYLPHILFYSISFIAIVFLIGYLTIPEVFFRFTATDKAHRLGGFIINPNELGVLLVIGISSSFVLFQKNRFFKNFLLLIGVFIMLNDLYLTYSRSSMAALVITLFIIYYLASRNKKIILFLAGGFIIMIPFIIEKIFVRGDRTEDLFTMTGRLPFWQDLLTHAYPQEWLFGYGFQRIYYTDRYSSEHSYAAEMAHNTYLQILLNLGMVGAITGGLLLSLLVYIVAKLKPGIKQYLLIIILIPILINSISEFGIFGFYNFDVLFFQMVLFYVVFTLKKGALYRC